MTITNSIHDQLWGLGVCGFILRALKILSILKTLQVLPVYDFRRAPKLQIPKLRHEYARAVWVR